MKHLQIVCGGLKYLSYLQPTCAENDCVLMLLSFSFAILF